MVVAQDSSTTGKAFAEKLDGGFTITRFGAEDSYIAQRCQGFWVAFTEYTPAHVQHLLLGSKGFGRQPLCPQGTG